MNGFHLVLVRIMNAKIESVVVDSGFNVIESRTSALGLQDSDITNEKAEDKKQYFNGVKIQYVIYY